MRLLVVGASLTGGYFACRLAQAARDITFLVRPARAEQLRAGGLRTKSPNGDARVAPKLVTAGGIRSTYDAVPQAVKAFSLEAALDDFAPAVGAGTVILPVLNEMRHMAVLTRRFGLAFVAGCTCKIAASVDGKARRRWDG